VAGAAALLKAVRPNWTPAQIRSALMATATNQNTVKEDGSTSTDPFDVGGGRIQVDSAAQAGFVLDETATAYTDANPGLGGDPTTLNIASLGDSQCHIACSWTRTISSTIGTSVEWNASTAAAAGMSLTVEPITFTLGAYATQVVTFTADVSGAPTGDWIFSQVNFTTTEPIPDAHFPVAVVPVSAVLPDQLDINARRDAGSRLLEELAAGEITDLDVGLSGLTEAALNTETLSQDSDNSTPYDDLSDGAFYVTVNVPAGAQRLVAEITASQAPDIDLFWGQDSNSNGMPDAGEELDSSTTSSYEEYLNLNDPPAGTYWVLVQNWDASAAGAADEVTLATAVVPGTDAGNMSVDGPTSVPAGTPFDIRLYWDTPTMEVGDRWYGAVSLGTDGSSPGNIGTVPVNVRRLEDDVTKTASATAALPGDTLTYTITIQPNMTQESVTYALTDTIPAGLTYVSGSASATAGTVSVTGDQLTWTGTLLPSQLTYYLSTSNDDPSCQTPVGGYWDLQTENGFPPDPGVSGDGIAFTYNDAPEIYGVPGGVLDYTDDGYATRSDTFSLVNQDLPDATSPNDLIAALWRDMAIVYDAGTNRGVTAASNSFLRIVEFDDIEDFNDSSQRLDMEIITFFEPVDNSPEIILAYDNVALTSNAGTIGVENGDGSEAVQFAYNDFIPTDGLVVCFDWRTTAEPVEITYQVTVDNDTPLGSTATNTVVNESDNPGSKIVDTSVTVRIGYRVLMPLIFKDGG
jgi:uncharacterized repeat protein (TIGR01451 family)